MCWTSWYERQSIVPLVEYVSLRFMRCVDPSYMSAAKIVDALTSNVKYDFDKGLQKLRASWKSLKALVLSASNAMQMDMHELLHNQAAVVDYIADQTLIMASNITNLRSSLEVVRQDQSSKSVRPTWHNAYVCT